MITPGMRKAAKEILKGEGVCDCNGCAEAAATIISTCMADELGKVRQKLEYYAECCGGCTCGDGWEHGPAREALAILGDEKEGG